MFVLLIIIAIVLIFVGISKLSEAKILKDTSETQMKNAEIKLQEIKTQKSRLQIKEIDLKKRESKVPQLMDELNKLTKTIEELNEVKHELSLEIEDNYDSALLSSYGSNILPALDASATSSEIKNELSMLKINEKELVLDGAIVVMDSLSKRELTNLKKKMLIPLESEISGLLNKLTISNVDSIRERIIKVFDKINRLFASEYAEFTKEYIELKLQELELNYSFIVKINDEREQQKAIKEQMIEEEKVRREIDREKKRIDKEERQFNSEITKLMSYMQKTEADVEKQLYADKIRELEEKLKELSTIKDNVLQRELNTRAGYVYIISNIGSFGENIYKIGMTRRLEPMDRIKELSSASVPFEFDVHAMIFSEDAPKLENQLHAHFRNQEVNKVNQRKEFFKVSLNEIERVVLEKYNGTVSFTKLAQAEEYRRSLELNKNK